MSILPATDDHYQGNIGWHQTENVGVEEEISTQAAIQTTATGQQVTSPVHSTVHNNVENSVSHQQIKSNQERVIVVDSQISPTQQYRCMYVENTTQASSSQSDHCINSPSSVSPSQGYKTIFVRPLSLRSPHATVVYNHPSTSVAHDVKALAQAAPIRATLTSPASPKQRIPPRPKIAQIRKDCLYTVRPSSAAATDKQIVAIWNGKLLVEVGSASKLGKDGQHTSSQALSLSASPINVSTQTASEASVIQNIGTTSSTSSVLQCKEIVSALTRSPPCTPPKLVNGVNSGSYQTSASQLMLPAPNQAVSGGSVTETEKEDSETQDPPVQTEPPPAQILGENEFKLCKHCGGLTKGVRNCESCGYTISEKNKTVTRKLPSKLKAVCQPCPPIPSIPLTKKSFYGKKCMEQSMSYGWNSLSPGTNCGGGVPNAGRGKRGKRLSRAKAKAEPVTVTISSDEEDSGTDAAGKLNTSCDSTSGVNSSLNDTVGCSVPNNVSPKSQNHTEDDNNVQTTSCNLDQSMVSHSPSAINPAESTQPNIRVSNVQTTCRVGTRRDRMEDACGKIPAKSRRTTTRRQTKEDNSGILFNDPTVTLTVRCVRVGTLKGEPVQPVFFSKDGLFIKMECSKNFCDVKITPGEIENIAVHLQSRLPVIFLNTSATCGLRLQKELLSCSTEEKFFDPAASDLPLKFITLLLQSQPVKNDQRALMSILQHFDRLKPHRENFVQTLSCDEAQTVLVKTTKSATKVTASVTTTKVKYFLMEDPLTVPPQSSESSDSISHGCSTSDRCAGTIEKLFTYRPASEKGGISISTEDLFCLKEGEFLNDVIIDFYLKYLMNEVLSEENKQRTYVFSSFFYKRLTQKQSRLTPDEKSQTDLKMRRHDRVKTWTRHVDLFAKDFIIVPINEHAHWFLAIICFPGEVKNKVQLTSSTPTSSPSAENSSTEEPMETSETEVNGQPQGRHESASLSHTQPCILVFDSLSGPARTTIVKTLREYLCVEWSAKKQTARTFDRDTVRGGYPKVPQQNNFSDCGIYVLQFVESFFKKPIHNFSIPIKHLQDWFTEEEVSKKRGDLRNLILSLHQKSKLEPNPS